MENELVDVDAKLTATGSAERDAAARDARRTPWARSRRRTIAATRPMTPKTSWSRTRRTRVHTTRRPEQHEPKICDRWSNKSTYRPPGQSAKT